MKLSDIFSSKGEIARKGYIIWGLLLFALKYNLDRLTAIYYNRNWFILDYFIQADHLSEVQMNGESTAFYLTLAISALPFIWFGTVLCMKRLRNAELPAWLVVFFFMPFLNFVLFVLLAAMPEKAHTEQEAGEPWVGRLIPQSKYGSVLFSVGIVTVVALLLTLLFVNVLGEYGWGLFMGVPFLLGFASVLLYSYHHQLIYSEVLSVCLLSVVAFSGIIFILAMEGVICLAMGFPILFGIALIGGTVAYGIQQNRRMSINAFAAPLLAIPLLGIIEHYGAGEPPLATVTTSVTVNASPQEVWDKLVAFSHIGEPTEFIFATGIAYPTHAEIDGKGVGAIRRCNFTTGTFVEPITTWSEPYLLQFGVIDQPPPMVEFSFYDELHIAHLDGYFKSKKGEFRLTKLDNGQTLLAGTTWYQHDIGPSFYWRLWSDNILHAIHFRVLNHIKQEAEAEHLSVNGR